MIRAFLFFSLFISIKAIGCEIQGYDQGIISNINIGQKQFKSVLPIGSLVKTPDFIIGESEFPKPVSEIVKVASNAIKKIDSELKWSVESIALYKYHYNNCMFWYYQVYFSSGNFYGYINVGLNGESPDVYRINEIKLK